MNNCLETKDWQGNRVIFPEKNRAAHEDKHPELKDETYIAVAVRRAIENPHFVYQDYNDPKRRIVCYVKESEYFGLIRYTKVVILKGARVRFVITAYSVTGIKEKTKNCKLLYGQPN